jgi:hypothetical protein
MISTAIAVPVHPRGRPELGSISNGKAGIAGYGMEISDSVGFVEPDDGQMTQNLTARLPASRG